jgi:hypothetical protein
MSTENVRGLNNDLLAAGAMLVSSLIALGVFAGSGGDASPRSLAVLVLVFGTFGASGAVMRAMAHDIPSRKRLDLWGKLLGLCAAMGAATGAGAALLAGLA